jgi:hypothetical protein
VYERPTTQTYQINATSTGPIFAAAEYYQNLDIVRAQAGLDQNYLYGSIDLFGVNRLTEDGKADFEGLKYQYEFLLSTMPDGANGFWLASKEGTPLGTAYQLLRNEGQKDTNGDVGGSGALNGLSITKSNNAAAALGNGFDTDWIDDGLLKSSRQEVLFSRLNLLDNSIIEFALDYKALGFTEFQIQQILAGQLGYLDFRAIKGGPKDPQNYLWNDEYTMNEAGSPYRCGATPIPCPDLTKSEFNTQGSWQHLRAGHAARARRRCARTQHAGSACRRSGWPTDSKAAPLAQRAAAHLAEPFLQQLVRSHVQADHTKTVGVPGAVTVIVRATSDEETMPTREIQMAEGRQTATAGSSSGREAGFRCFHCMNGRSMK